ncbi:MAG: hypothetical protein C1943_15545 [Halochromatium sp.]|nr:hypothetical protein [Halochromatium sp.]
MRGRCLGKFATKLAEQGLNLVLAGAELVVGQRLLGGGGVGLGGVERAGQVGDLSGERVDARMGIRCVGHGVGLLAWWR